MNPNDGKKNIGYPVKIDGTTYWRNADGTFDEVPLEVDPKVTAWFKKGLKKSNE